MRLGQSATPDGMRLYAIGDVHGCDGLIAEAHQKIAVDLALHPISDYRIIHIGDYADRGPDSAAVIERLAGLAATDPRVICLKGNHDELLVGFLSDPAGFGATFLFNGGDATLASYGVPASGLALIREDFLALSRALQERVPAAHRAFLESLRLTARFGDYLFCHAGIRPGVALDRQDPHDLTWIREDFLWDRSDHGVVVVHGHTPANEPEVRPNRINIDTGAVYGGRLTTLALEGRAYRFL
ncbi:MAG: metallophosphoesterase [Bauldia sp.]